MHKLVSLLQMAPAGVLPGQPEHQLLALGSQSRASGTTSSAEGSPATADQRAVPAEERGRLYQERDAGGQPAAERGHDRAIGLPPAWSSGGASEDEQLLAEDEELRSRSALGRPRTMIILWKAHCSTCLISQPFQ